MKHPRSDENDNGLNVLASNDKSVRDSALLEEGWAVSSRLAMFGSSSTKSLTEVNKPVSSANKITRSVKEQMKFVVKIYATVAKPHYSMPWQMTRQQISTSSGFVVSGRRILTNAHSVAYQTEVRVRKHGCATKIPARVIAVGHACDVALLTVDDDSFWEDFGSEEEELHVGGLPSLQDRVTVVGYPTGGDNISVTAGVISRVDMQAYSHSHTNLLTIQIDAAINAGNSGGPAFDCYGRIVGIAFETLDDAENIGYIIPVSVVQHFLAEVAMGKYGSRGVQLMDKIKLKEQILPKRKKLKCNENVLSEISLNGNTDVIETNTIKDNMLSNAGFGSLGFHYQMLENSQLRDMPVSKTGILITHVCSVTAAARKKIIRPGDVILALDGIRIADDGTIAFRDTERISFQFRVSQKFIGDVCTLSLWRDGEVKIVEIVVESRKTISIVPKTLYDMRPSYVCFIFFSISNLFFVRNFVPNDFFLKYFSKIHFVLAGLVFTVLSEPFLYSEWGKGWDCKAPIRFVKHALLGKKAHADEQVVILQQILSNNANVGYDSEKFANQQVMKCNGVSIRNIKQLVDLVQNIVDGSTKKKEKYLKFELVSDSVVVLLADTARRATKEVLIQHNIPNERSADLN